MKKHKLKVVKGCGGKRGKGCGSAFEWVIIEKINEVKAAA